MFRLGDPYKALFATVTLLGGGEIQMIYCTCNVRKLPKEIYQVNYPSAVYVLQSSQCDLKHVSNKGKNTIRKPAIPKANATIVWL